MSEITRNQAIQIVEDIRTAISAGSVTNTMEAQVLEYCVSVLGRRIVEASLSGHIENLPDVAAFLAGISPSATLKALLEGITDAVGVINANIGNGYVYAGIATPSGTPVSGKVFYLAKQAGQYANFGGLTVTEGVNILKRNGSTWTQEQLLSMADIRKNPLIGYYECDTAGDTSAKTVTAAGYVLPATGGSVKIKMANRNTVANATLNINSTGAKPLYYNGQRAGVGNTWDTNEIIEVFYDGAKYQAYNVAGCNGDGVFDISAYNLTNGQPTPYEDLATALGPNGDNVPLYLRKGGMIVTFLHDNKYIQARCMAQNFTTDVTQWQGIDKIPTLNSLNITESNGIALSSGAFDVSAYNKVGNTFAVYESLAALLATTPLPIPDEYVRLGVSIKFIQGESSSDDNRKYVQYFYNRPSIGTNNAKFLNPANWQGVDAEPINNSKNLVISGGVKAELDKKLENSYGKNLLNLDDPTIVNGKYLYLDGTNKNGSQWSVSGFIAVEPETTYYASGEGDTPLYWGGTILGFYDANKDFIGYAEGSLDGTGCVFTTPSGCYYIKTSFNTALKNKMINLGNSRGYYHPYSAIGGYTESCVNEVIEDSIEPLNRKTDSCVVKANIEAIDISANYTDGKVNRSGKISASDAYRYSSPILVEAGKGVSVFTYGNNIAPICEINQNGELIRVICNYTSTTESITKEYKSEIFEKDTYVRLCWYNNSEAKAYFTEYQNSETQRINSLIAETHLPSYYDEYLATKQKEIRDIEFSLNGTEESFIFISDTHWLINYKKSPYIIEHLLKQGLTTKVIFGGDICNINAQTDDNPMEAILGQVDFHRQFEAIVSKYGRFYNVRGNHDINGYPSSDSTGELWDAPVNVVENMLIEPMLNRGIIDNVYLGYNYTFDEEAKKTRFIIFSKGALKGGGSHDVTQQDLEWLISVISSTPANYKIIVVSHYGATVPTRSTGDNPSAYILPLIESVNRKESGSINGASYDFTNATYSIIAFFSGHAHKNLQTYTEGIIHISIGCDCRASERPFMGENFYLRTAGTIYEQLMDFVIIDINNKIYCKRIGRGADRFFNFGINNVSVGSSITLTSTLSGTLTWGAYDNDSAVSELGTLTRISVSDGVVTGIENGEVVVYAKDSSGNREFFDIIVS